MRWIRKTNEPVALIKWRLKYKKDINFGYELMRKDQEVIRALTTALLEEQGWLCAYTGRPIGEGSFHIEHLRAQARRCSGEDVDYRNMVACYPEPNRGWPCPYGADEKRDWPKPGEDGQFVSPLDQGCEVRFNFTYSGKIKPALDSDQAAQLTIKNLKLDHGELTELRRDAIRGALQPKGKPLSRAQATQLLDAMERRKPGKLQPFEFAIRRALRNHLTVLSKGTRQGQP